MAALESMARLLRRGGRLVLASRNWDIAPRWEQEHHIEIAVAQVGVAGSVLVRSELLSCWPYRYDQLEVELDRVGLRIEMSTFDPEAENYRVVASKV